jgi:hypothetical protein
MFRSAGSGSVIYRYLYGSGSPENKQKIKKNIDSYRFVTSL